MTDDELLALRDAGIAHPFSLRYVSQYSKFDYDVTSEVFNNKGADADREYLAATRRTGLLIVSAPTEAPPETGTLLKNIAKAGALCGLATIAAGFALVTAAPLGAIGVGTLIASGAAGFGRHVQEDAKTKAVNPISLEEMTDRAVHQLSGFTDQKEAFNQNRFGNHPGSSTAFNHNSARPSAAPTLDNNADFTRTGYMHSGSQRKFG